MPSRTVNIDKEAYRREWLKAHASYERTQYRNFKKALDAQCKPVIDYLRLHGITGLEQTLTLLVSAQPMREAYLRCYTMVGVQSAGFTYKSIQNMIGGKSYRFGETKDSPIGFFSQAWRKLMSFFYQTDAADMVTNVTETTRDRVKELLDQSDEMNLTVDQRATFIADEMDDPEFNRARGLVIARTETTRAANKGAALGAASADYITVKEWLAVMDKNTRHTHMIANGQQVDNDADFEVGSELAQYPGDPRLSARETIQCRCTVLFIPVLSAAGLPVLK